MNVTDLFEPLAMPKPYSDAEMLAWDMYFGTLVGMSLHPGNVREERMLAICAHVADQMLNERRKRMSPLKLNTDTQGE
jgi:hypothetical protein